MLNQSQARNFQTRSLIGGAMLGLLRRSEGLHLLDFNEGIDKQRGSATLGTDVDFSGLIADGYSVDSIETQPDGTAVAHCSKIVGLKYPVPGYSVRAEPGAHLLKGEVPFPEYGRISSPASVFFDYYG